MLSSGPISQSVGSPIDMNLPQTKPVVHVNSSGDKSASGKLTNSVSAEVDISEKKDGPIRYKHRLAASSPSMGA